MQGVSFAILNVKMQFEKITWIKLPGAVIDEGAIKVHVPCPVETQVFIETVYIYVEIKPFSDATSLVDIHHVHHYILFCGFCVALQNQ